MDIIIIIISLVILLVLGALFVIPKSQNKGSNLNICSSMFIITYASYTKEEVSKHNTRKDCWIVIKDKVYDVTPYVEEHPGGDAILNNAGGDSTEGFFGFVNFYILCLLHCMFCQCFRLALMEWFPL
ncbi:hypothetical protein PR202_gb03400 [Eleusine coracana subsp. coracana]|uniref:Cytochrome b5 heme-binding domain-containing protein n=1 Tax=Eleusine coracana subsp. coracana TaxID=191504 RepID=A0AAV5E1B7_ELECO|nr:hypothetical protein PR202_gb03400 [Eleusine coracana subsp. coracana]